MDSEGPVSVTLLSRTERVRRDVPIVIRASLTNASARQQFLLVKKFALINQSGDAFFQGTVASTCGSVKPSSVVVEGLATVVVEIRADVSCWNRLWDAVPTARTLTDSVTAGPYDLVVVFQRNGKMLESSSLRVQLE
jgi:hypothetical protein